MMKESKQNTNKMDHFSFLQKVRFMAKEADHSIEQYAQHFIEQVDEAFNNSEPER